MIGRSVTFYYIESLILHQNNCKIYGKLFCPVQIRAKTQLRVNGLSFGIYFTSFFLVMFVVLLIVFVLLVLVAYLCGVAWLDTAPSVTVFGILMSFFCPSAIIVATTLSYCFHKTESAASILPGVMLFPGLIPYFTIVFVKCEYVISYSESYFVLNAAPRKKKL